MCASCKESFKSEPRLFIVRMLAVGKEISLQLVGYQSKVVHNVHFNHAKHLAKRLSEISTELNRQIPR